MKREYNIIPVSKPRQTRSDRWKKRPSVMKYRAFADEVRANKIIIPSGGAHITFIIPFPVSYSKRKKKKLNGKPHFVKKRNDIDNLQKALMDAIFDDDSHIWDIRCTKLWGYEGKIIIET